MSAHADVVLGALADEPLTSAEVVDKTGLERRVVSNQLFYLKTKGLIALTGGKYSVADGTPATAKARIVVHRETEPASAETKPSKREPKRGRKRVALPPPAASVPQTNGRTCEFAIAESGAILFKIIAGPKSGELGEIASADAMALYRLMSQVEFITENA